MTNDSYALGGTREETDPQSDPHNAIAQMLTEAESEQVVTPITAETIAEARNILGEIGSSTEEAPPEKVERLRQILEEIDPARAAECIDSLLDTSSPHLT